VKGSIEEKQKKVLHISLFVANELLCTVQFKLAPHACPLLLQGLQVQSVWRTWFYPLEAVEIWVAFALGGGHIMLIRFCIHTMQWHTGILVQCDVLDGVCSWS
jgi:hypothetical protein